MKTIVHKKISILTAEHPAEHLVFNAIILAIVCTCCLYAYLVSMTALNVIAGREAAARAATLESTVGSMQQQYFALSQAVAAAAPDSAGLVRVAETAYVYRQSTVGLVTSTDNAN